MSGASSGQSAGLGEGDGGSVVGLGLVGVRSSGARLHSVLSLVTIRSCQPRRDPRGATVPRDLMQWFLSTDRASSRP